VIATRPSLQMHLQTSVATRNWKARIRNATASRHQKAQVGQLQNAIKSDQALIEQAQVELGYTQLTSPISGITGVRQIDVGNIIHPTTRMVSSS